MSRLPGSPRVLLVLGVLVGVVILIETTGLAGWLSYVGFTAMFLLAPLAVVGVALMGVWTGIKYVRDRGWEN